MIGRGKIFNCEGTDSQVSAWSCIGIWMAEKMDGGARDYGGARVPGSRESAWGETGKVSSSERGRRQPSSK